MINCCVDLIHLLLRKLQDLLHIHDDNWSEMLVSLVNVAEAAPQYFVSCTSDWLERFGLVHPLLMVHDGRLRLVVVPLGGLQVAQHEMLFCLVLGRDFKLFLLTMRQKFVPFLFLAIGQLHISEKQSLSRAFRITHEDLIFLRFEIKCRGGDVLLVTRFGWGRLDHF